MILNKLAFMYQIILHLISNYRQVVETITLIVGTQKWGVSCKVQRRPRADIFLNESLPRKTPCGHHVHGRHDHGSPVKNR